MPKFEVHIPAAGPAGFNMTLKVGADNWMAALKAGMQKLGEQGSVGQNVMVDIQDDNSVHITEAGSGRVFRIRELTEDEAAKAPLKRPSGIFRPGAPQGGPGQVPPARRGPKTDPALPVVQVNEEKTLPPVPAHDPAPRAFDPDKTLVPGSVPALTEEQLKPSYEQVRTAPPGPTPAQGKEPTPARPAKIPSPATQAALPTRQPTKPRPPVKSSPRIELSDVEELEAPVKPVTGQIGRPRTSPGIQATIRQQTEDILSDVFMRITELEGKASLEDAMQFLLDLAMEKVPCEAGSVLRSDGASGDLQFVVARGPRAKDLIAKKIVLPAGEGIAGFCAAEGVSVAVGDVQKDPRFYAGVGEKIDYETKSLLCAPMMTHGRSFGCVQLINRKGSAQFLEHEMGVLAYLSHQGALYLNTRY